MLLYNFPSAETITTVHGDGLVGYKFARGPIPYITNSIPPDNTMSARELVWQNRRGKRPMIDSSVCYRGCGQERQKNSSFSVARILFPSRVDVANATKSPIRRWTEREKEREREKNYTRSVTIIVPLVRRIARISRALLHPLYTRENNVAFSAVQTHETYRVRVTVFYSSNS